MRDYLGKWREICEKHKHQCVKCPLSKELERGYESCVEDEPYGWDIEGLKYCIDVYCENNKKKKIEKPNLYISKCAAENMEQVSHNHKNIFSIFQKQCELIDEINKLKGE